MILFCATLFIVILAGVLRVIAVTSDDTSSLPGSLLQARTSVENTRLTFPGFHTVAAGALESEDSGHRVASFVTGPFGGPLALGSSNSSLTHQACGGTADCCPGSAPADCPFICHEGAELNEDGTTQGSGGACVQKWAGFCLQDDGCPRGYICQQRSGRRAGTCMQDTHCDAVSCGRGFCRLGTCTCEYGVVGTMCDRSLEAFAFLFYGNSSESLLSARVLVKSLRAGGATQDVVAVIPAHLAEHTPREFLHVLEEDGVKVHRSEPIPMLASSDADPVVRLRWSRLAVWRLTHYSQVALLDADMMFSLDTQNPQQIFSECTAPLCAVRDGDTRGISAGGVMVAVPSWRRLDHILHVLHTAEHGFALPEQSFFTWYCKNAAYRMPLQFLNHKWSSCVRGSGGVLRKGWESTGTNVLGPCSWRVKPPSIRMCLPGACNAEEEWHAVLLWQLFHRQVDPCVSYVEVAVCVSSGLTLACHWCGHYCGDARVPCSSTLFKLTGGLRGNTDEVGTDPARADKAGTSSRRLSGDKSVPEWSDPPRGSWAWPQVALYQILIDRFASPSGKRCDARGDYCGGTVSGIRSKMWYLESLGVDGVVLSPIVEQMPHGYHGHWTKDLNSVNPNYGTEADIRALVVLLHERKMKAFVDVNLNHAGGPTTNASDPSSVAELSPFNHSSFYHSEACSVAHDGDYKLGPIYVERCKLYGLLDYNHENPMVWQELMLWVRTHVDKYGFDGVRVAAARHIPRSFLDHVPQVGPPIPAFFEVVNGDMKYVASYATGDYGAVYNYPLYFMLRDVFVPGPRQRPMADLAEWMATNAAFAGGRLLLNFLDNNDLPRFVRHLNGDGLLYHNALLCVLGMEGLPVLLYGSEQDQQGDGLIALDLPKADAWRPPLWHAGYNESTPTFKLIRKVLWLRQRLHGMHHMKRRTVFADHRVLVFARGPVLFAVTNSHGRAAATTPLPPQPLLFSDSPAPVRLCNLLAREPREECTVVVAGSPWWLHLSGDPKVLVPFVLVKEYEEHGRLEQEGSRVQASSKVGEPQVLPFSHWHEMPDAPAISVEVLTRVPRAFRPGDVIMNDDPSVVWHPLPKLPPHLDTWGPPLGAPVPHVVSASLRDACFYLGAGEEDGAILARRGTHGTFVLCPDAPYNCPEVMAKISLQRLKAHVEHSETPVMSKGVVYLTYDTWYGVYHMLVSTLPSIAPILPELTGGRMLAFFHTGRSLVTPVLSYLGVDESAFFFPPLDSPLPRPYSFCTQEMHFDMGTRPQYPRAQFVSGHLHTFRQALLPVSGQPCTASPRGIVVLSRANSSRAVSNEEEVVDALQTLGRPVAVLNAALESFPRVMEMLSQAALLVGAHGANMANMVYAPEGTTVVEVVPQVPFTLVDFHFRELAGALNFTYVPFGQAVQSEEFNVQLTKNAMTQDKAVPSFAVNSEKLKGLVASLLP